MGRDDRRSRSRSPNRVDVMEICWKPVRDDPTNFDAWIHLLQTVEQLDESKPARQAFDEFLTKFPFCYGYWRKYAELEKRHKHLDRAIDVYDRGVQAIPLSIDLWSSYITIYKDYMKDSENRIKKVRYLYERAVTTAGLEFRSDKLWESYINWEVENNNYPQALNVFDKVLKVPTLLYASHFEKLQEFVNDNPPDKILSDVEYEPLFHDIERDLKEKGVTEVYIVEEVTQADPEFVTLTDTNGIKLEPQAQYRKRYNDDALKQFRVAIIDKRRKYHLYTEQEVSKRWTFEEAIKRPYFHVKPLERAQLKNWRNYLDFEIQAENRDRIQVLFERCLIACAMYEDLWIRYARWLERSGDLDGARETYKRACTIHLTKKPLPTIAWSAFEEAQGKEDAAVSILQEFERRNPGFLQIQLRRLGLERRIIQRKNEDRPDYSSVNSRYEKLLRDPSTPVKTLSFYAIKFARFHCKVRNDRKLANKILLDALSRDEMNPLVHLQLIDIVFNSDPMKFQDVVDAFDRALHSKMSDEQKLKFSQRKLEFMEDFAMDIRALQEHLEYHLKLIKSQGISSSSSSSSTQKRKSTALEGKNGDCEAKQIKSETSSADVSSASTSNVATPTNSGQTNAETGQYYSYTTGSAPPSGAAQQQYYYQQHPNGGGAYYYAPPY